MGRAPCCDKANVKKGPWSPEEDSKLKEYIEKHGTGGNWIALPQKAGLRRCGKSCRLRWLNYLRPNIKHGEFSDEEDRIICTLYANIGSRWSIIAAQLPGRTDNDIKNYWNTKLKKKLMGLHPSAAASHYQQKKLPYQSSPQNPSFPSQYNSTTTTTTTTSYYNHPNTSFTTNLEQISVPSSSSSYTISHQLPFYQNQESSTSSMVISPMQYYNMFGSEGSCSSSSDGSCSFVKQEEMMMGFQNFVSNGNKLMVSQSENVNNQWEGEKSNNGCFSPLDCDIELIKQLISSSSSCNNNNNNNDGYLNFSVDESKTKEEKSMYYYYY